MKNKIACIICVLGALCLFGCLPYKGYTGDYPELFTVAVNIVPDAKGVIYSETEHQPAIGLLQEDNQGRRLFYYTEDNNTNITVYLIICQFFDNENVYYYNDINYISILTENRIIYGGTKFPSSIRGPLTGFTDEQIIALKQTNDWDQELNIEKCVKTRIVRKV